MKKAKPSARRRELLTMTFPAVRVSEQVYRFYELKRQAERRGKISEVVRIALEDYAKRQPAGKR